MPDYSKGKIYTIRCRNDATLIYVGSTIQPLAKRWGQHKAQYLKTPNYILYQAIDNNWDNWYIELYEPFPCNCKEELCKKEGEVIRLIGNLNFEIAGRTQKEYHEENKEKIIEYQKEYRENNREKLNENGKIFYENNKNKINEKITCSCGGCYTTQHKSSHLKTKKHTDYLLHLGTNNTSVALC
jgi:hypothetical protein